MEAFYSLNMNLAGSCWLQESIEVFLEDQAFSALYDLAPHPPPAPLPSAGCLFFSVFLCVTGIDLTDGKGGGGDKPNNMTTARKPAWSSINHSIVIPSSEFYPLSEVNKDVVLSAKLINCLQGYVLELQRGFIQYAVLNILYKLFKI